MVSPCTLWEEGLTSISRLTLLPLPSEVLTVTSVLLLSSLLLL